MKKKTTKAATKRGVVLQSVVGEIESRIASIEKDERYNYPPAQIQINAPLALIQVDMKASVCALRWVLSIIANQWKNSKTPHMDASRIPCGESLGIVSTVSAREMEKRVRYLEDTFIKTIRDVAQDVRVVGAVGKSAGKDRAKIVMDGPRLLMLKLFSMLTTDEAMDYLNAAKWADSGLTKPK